MIYERQVVTPRRDENGHRIIDFALVKNRHLVRMWLAFVEKLDGM